MFAKIKVLHSLSHHNSEKVYGAILPYNLLHEWVDCIEVKLIITQ